MAEHERKKVKDDEEVRRSKKSAGLAPEKLKAQDGVIEANPIRSVMDEPSLDGHTTVIGDARFSHPANLGQRANIIKEMQHSHGNAYVQRLLSSGNVQAKLTVNPPDDKYEKEADRVAEVVVRVPDSQIERQPALEESMMKKAAGGHIPEVTEELEMGIDGERGRGQPLSEQLRASLEPNLGCDLSEVRMHTDNEADRLSQQLGARAFTTGSDVFFREGAYQPESQSGRGLIAHEMTHVVQQGAARIYRQAAGTEEEAATDPLQDAKKGVESALEKLKTKQDREHMHELIHFAWECANSGMGESAWRWMTDAAADLALEILESKTRGLDVKSAKQTMAQDLLKALEDAMLLGAVDEGAFEKAFDKVQVWAEEQLRSALKKLETAPRLENAREVAVKMQLAQLLGGDTTEADIALDPWMDELTKKEETGKAE